MRWGFLRTVFLAGCLSSWSWGADPKPGGTTIQLPTFGVAVDAQGELTVKSFVDPTGELRARRIAAARTKLSADIAAPSKLRKVSLVRLEQSVAESLSAGRPLDESQEYLAGLQRIQYVFLYPAAKDIVVAGPAEGWVADAAGRVVGQTTGKPVLRLDDLAVALRIYARGGVARPFLGCTIDPPPEGLARLRQFQKEIPNVVRANQRAEVALVAARGTQTALGLAEVRLFGVPPATHFAQVLVEADYRMKCTAIGLEPPPVPMTTFLGSLRSLPSNSLQRWWFTPNYQCVRLSEDGLALEVVGQGVQLQTEDRAIGPDGNILASASSPHPAASAFAKSFTEQFPMIAAASPVYAELRNLIDLAIVAAWFRQQDTGAKTGWAAGLLRDESRLEVESYTVPKKVACVANSVWSGNRLFVPAGGGVSISPDQALEKDRLLAPNPQLAIQRQSIESTRPQGESWWWD